MRRTPEASTAAPSNASARNGVETPTGIVAPMERSAFSVRPASPDDAEAWVAIHLASWREA